MDITLSLSITDGDEPVSEYDIIHLSKSINPDDLIGLSLAESSVCSRHFSNILSTIRPASLFSHRNIAPAAEQNAESKIIETVTIARYLVSYHYRRPDCFIVTVRKQARNRLAY